jgi:hypothetical protein
VRLEKLTDIRHDHAAQAMKDLIAMKIIIHRAGGEYRNWLSINFNFDMWGDLSIAEQYKSNNPERLLPTKYTETPIDNGLQLDPTKLHNLVSTVENTAYSHTVAVGTASTTNSQVSSTQNTAIDEQAVQKLETKLTTLFSQKLSSALETINQTLHGFEQHLSTAISTQTSVLTADESIPEKPAPELAKTDDTSVINTASSQPQETQEVVVASSNNNDYVVEIAPFNYPEKLDTEQCQALQGLLSKSGNRAQDLLNLLAQRLQNTKNPVLDPASYFASLVYKYKNNQLDFSGLSAIKLPKSAEEKAQKEHFKELKFQHLSYHNDYVHFQSLIEVEMKKSQQSFNEVCENNPLGGIIEDCSNKLLKAKRALDDFLAGNNALNMAI